MEESARSFLLWPKRQQVSFSIGHLPGTRSTAKLRAAVKLSRITDFLPEFGMSPDRIPVLLGDGCTALARLLCAGLSEWLRLFCPPLTEGIDEWYFYNMNFLDGIGYLYETCFRQKEEAVSCCGLPYGMMKKNSSGKRRCCWCAIWSPIPPRSCGWRAFGGW